MAGVWPKYLILALFGIRWPQTGLKIKNSKFCFLTIFRNLLAYSEPKNGIMVSKHGKLVRKNKFSEIAKCADFPIQKQEKVHIAPKF